MKNPLTRALCAALVAMGAWAAAPATAQANGAVADLRPVLLKSTGGAWSYEQYANTESIAGNTPVSRQLGAANVRAIASDGDQWFSIQRTGNGQCFLNHASYQDLTQGRAIRRVCNTVIGYDGYRGLTTDGHLFYTVFWDGSRHWWQSYMSWDDVINNRPSSMQTDYRVGDIYKGIAFDPVSRVFLSLAQHGSTVYLLRYATYTDMVTIKTTPADRIFSSGDSYAAFAIGPVNPTLSIYLVAGQSNAVGWSNNGAWLPAHAADAQVRFFYRIGGGMDWAATTSGDVTTLKPQIAGFGRATNSPTLFGIEMGALRTLHDNGRKNMAVVKVAMGGTNLASEWNPVNGQGLYRLMQENYSTASAKWNAMGYRTRLVGLLWMQGEADATDQTMANNYANNLKGLVATVRQMAGDRCMPVVVGRIRKEWPINGPVRAAQEQLAANDKCAAWVDTDDLTLYPNDWPHFSDESEYRLGQRFGEAYRRISGW